MLEIRSPTAQIETVNLTHSAAVTSKTPVVVNSKVVIPLDDADASAEATYVRRAVISDAPMAAVTPAALAPCYWDDTAKVFTNVVGTNVLCGYFLEAVASGAVTGLIAFDSFQA